jgi:hypothetical protein
MTYARVMSELPPGTGVIMQNFAAGMALLEDWNIPGLNGNPKAWDFGKVDLPIIAWVNFFAVTSSFLKCFDIPKDF